MPDVAVAVSTFERADGVSRLLGALERQDLAADRFEVAICDDGSSDETWEAMRRRVDASPISVRLVRHAENRGPAAGRNSAWRATTSPVIAFTDDDCAPEHGWLRAGLEAMTSGDHGRGRIVQGHVAPPPGSEHLAAEPFARTMRVDAADYFATCNVFYRREDLVEVDGFAEVFTDACGEDTELALRVLAGRPVDPWYEAGAIVYHDVRRSNFLLAVRDVRRWVSVPRVVRLHPGVRDRYLQHRYFWRPTHPTTVVALVGLALGLRRPAAIALVLPWVHMRLRRFPACPSRRRRLLSLPGVFVIDALEVATMIRGSIRHRALVL